MTTIRFVDQLCEPIEEKMRDDLDSVVTRY